MNINSLLESLQTTLGSSIPGILGAVAILVVGWLCAIVVKTAIKKGLSFIKLNQHMDVGGDKTREIDVEGGIATGMFYITLLVVLLAVFNALSLDVASAPIQALLTQIFAYAPNLIAGIVLILVAWVVATISKTIIVKSLSVTNLDKKLSEAAHLKPISASFGDVGYWFVLLLFLPAILGVFQLSGLLSPVQAMVDKILTILPDIVAGIVIGLVGWTVARILRDLVSNLLAATGTDNLGKKVGLTDDYPLSRLVGLVVYIFVLIPSLIAALNALQIAAISAPATKMLDTVMAAIPNIIAAGIILIISYYLARLVSHLIAKLLSGMSFDTLPEKIGLGKRVLKEPTLSTLTGNIVFFFAMLFAVVAASVQLGFPQVSELVSTFIEFGSQVLLGSVIIGVGLWLANLVHDAVLRATSNKGSFAAGLVKVIILGLVFAMGLRAMGIANDIVNLAFGLTLGSIAITVALSFGLGGRDAAGRKMEQWIDKFSK